MSEEIEPGDLVFLVNSGRCPTRGRAKVVKVDGDRLHVIPLPRHRRIEIVPRSRARLWKAEKNARKALEARRGSRGSRRGSREP